MRFLSTYKFGRNNTYQTTVQAGPVEMDAAVVHNAQRARTRQNRAEPPERKIHKHPRQNETRHRTQYIAPSICRNIKKPGKIFLNFLKKSDFTGKKWILCRENSGKIGLHRLQPHSCSRKKQHQHRKKQHQHREKAASGTARAAEKHGTGADAAGADTSAARTHSRSGCQHQPERMQQNAKKHGTAERHQNARETLVYSYIAGTKNGIQAETQGTKKA